MTAYVVSTLDRITVSEDVEQIDLTAPATAGDTDAAEHVAYGLVRLIPLILGERDDDRQDELFEALESGTDTLKAILQGETL